MKRILIATSFYLFVLPIMAMADNENIYHIVSTGQSNSLGVKGPPLSFTPSFNNMKLTPDNTDLVPLIEPVIGLEPRGEVETHNWGLANFITKYMLEINHLSDYKIIVSTSGMSGMPYSVIKKGGTYPERPINSYAHSLQAVKKSFEYASSQNENLIVPVILLIHGEGDAFGNTPNYDQSILEMQNDYEQDIRSITAQREHVMLFINQFPGNIASYQNSLNIRSAQLKASIESPYVFLIGPTYMLPLLPDGIHLTNEGFRQLGEMFGKVYIKIFHDHINWTPLMPKNVKMISPTTIHIDFNVPAPPLQWNNLIKVPNRGFEVLDSSGNTLKIDSVLISGDTSVEINIDSNQVIPNNLSIVYASRSYSNYPGGAGALHDSDDTQSQYGYDLSNYSVVFKLNI